MGIEDLAAYLVLGDSQRKAIAEDDPYSSGQQLGNSLFQSVLQDTVSRPDAGSMKDRVASAAVTSLLGGLFGGLSNDYRARASNAYQDTVSDTIMGKGGDKPSVLSPSIFSDARQRGSLFKIQQAIEDRKLQNEVEKLTQVENVKSTNEAGKEVLKSLLSANPKEREQATRLARMLGLKDFAGPSPDTAPIGIPVKNASRFGNGETISDKLEAQTQRFLEAGATPSAAGEMASRAIEGDRIVNRSQAKRIEDLRQGVSKLDEVIGTAKAGVDGAGNTGGFGGGVRDWLSSMYAYVSPEEQKQRDAQRMLDSTAPDVVKMARSPGALSDREVAMLVKSGPSSANTPSENRALIGKLEAVKQLQGEYADFLDTYLSERGDLRGADQLWGKYKAANPLFIETDGGLVANTQRKPWDQFDFGAGNAGTAQQQAGTTEEATAEMPAGATPTGRTSGGKPVYQMPDGRLWVP